jgi:hypothetical protein
VPREQRTFASTLREVGLRGRDRDTDWERTTIELVGELEGSSKGAGNETDNGED